MSEFPELDPQLSAELLLDRIDDAVLPPLVRSLLQRVAELQPPDEAIGQAIVELPAHLHLEMTDDDLRHWLLTKANVEQATALHAVLLNYRKHLMGLSGPAFVSEWKELLSNPGGVGLARHATLLFLKQLREPGV